MMSNQEMQFDLMADQQQQQQQSYFYTYQLPYGVRRDICNLLDADQSWRQLAGQYLGLDTTQLTLLGQAYLRNCSPSEELFNKFDSTNMTVGELCQHLKRMNHNRAHELLKPYATVTRADSLSLSLNTPGASVCDMAASNYYFDQQPADGLLAAIEPKPMIEDNKSECQLDTKSAGQPPTTCHNDPGEEIVRMACANNRKRTSISDQEVVNQLRLIMQINYNELKQASNEFSASNILGNGGFASVYHGNWKGTDVAIKRLRCNLMDQALNELTILNSYRIDNILPIYGISIDGPEACLVYQFMSNGSLEDRLACKKDTAPLSWVQRCQIAEGTAKGLYYLHTLRDKPLVHGDLKPANVLLDAQFIPKLGDFGLARQVFRGKNPQAELATHCTVSSIHGTSVYLPPEYLRHKILSSAVDVYSYGIVLLEMATGRRAYDGKRLLIDVVEDETRQMDAGQIGYSLKDPRLNDESENELRLWFELLVKLGLNCAHRIKKKRPNMGQVLGQFTHFEHLLKLATDEDQQKQQQQMQQQQRLTTPSSELNSTVPIAGKKRKQPKQQPTQDPSRALMSVEEITEDQVVQNPQINQPAEVEAMIPLITELGIVAQEAVE